MLFSYQKILSLLIDWPPGTQPSTPTATAAVRASFFPPFCGFFAHDSFFPSFHVGSTPWTRTSTIARLCFTSAALDPPTGSLLGPWEFSRLLPRPVGMWLGQTYMLKVCLPGHEGSISCPYVMYCSVLTLGFSHCKRSSPAYEYRFDISLFLVFGR